MKRIELEIDSESLTVGGVGREDNAEAQRNAEARRGDERGTRGTRLAVARKLRVGWSVEFTADVSTGLVKW